MKLSKFFASIILPILLVLQVSGTALASESAGEFITDTAITTKVKAAILNEPDLKSMEIKVETINGVVQLSGFVSTKANIQKALEVTRHIKGVKSIKNGLHIK